MASSTDICNKAISHLGIGKEIANLETERTAEALACRRFYSDVIEEVLRDYAWPFATKFADLELVEEDPTSEWGYSYRYPSDCLEFRRILSGVRSDTPDTRIPYRIGQDSQGRLIFTDQDSAEGEYTARVTEAARFTADFVSAASLLLASYIAPRLTAGDPYKLGERALRLYAAAIGKAQMNARNEEQADPTPDSEFIRAREM